MTQGLDIAGPVATLILALPLVLLVLLVARALRADRALRRASEELIAKRRVEAPPGGAAISNDVPLPALAAEIAAAESADNHGLLVGLYYAGALRALADGNVTQASDYLRRNIRLAVALGNHLAHAKARLELGDIARAGGDLTTACEHWQIARDLFLKDRRGPELEGTEARMRQHGCPTDWVLNDF